MYGGSRYHDQERQVPAKIKEFAYFGFGITLVSAAIAHFASGDARISPLFILDPLVFLCLLAVSYVYFNKAGAMARHPPAPLAIDRPVAARRRP
jgi:hypothetical protein